MGSVARRWRASVGAVVVVALVVGALMLPSVQRRLTYFPTAELQPVDDALPGAVAVEVTPTDGPRLEAWWLAGGSTAVVVLPGNAGNRGDRVPLARALAASGLSVLLVDYRGYGGNPGRPSEAGLVADGLAAVDRVAQEPGITHTVLLGESLGAAVAVAVATEPDIDALVLRSPFVSLPAVARAHFGPVPEWLLRDRYPVADRIAEVDAPVLVIAGPDDEIVPFSQSEAVHAAAPQPKRLVSVPAAGHNDAALTHGPAVIAAVVDFLGEHGLVGRGPSTTG